MKKSKFLKKSLAMLLALMLVVAMIPLSASAALPSLSYIYVVTTVAPEAEVDVPQALRLLQMRLNSGLGSNYELRVLACRHELNDTCWWTPTTRRRILLLWNDQHGCQRTKSPAADKRVANTPSTGKPA